MQIPHVGRINAIAVSPDGKWFASAGADHTIKIWDASSGLMLRTLAGHNGSVNCLAISADSRRIASGGGDAVAIVWDVASGDEIRRIATVGERQLAVFEAAPASNLEISAIALSPDASSLVLTGAGGLQRWDIATGRTIASKSLRMTRGRRFADISNDGQIAAVISPDGAEVEIWETRSVQLSTTIRRRKDALSRLTGVRLNRHGSLLAVSTESGEIEIYEARTGRALPLPPAPASAVALTLAYDGMLCLRPQRTARGVWTLATGTEANSPDGRWVLNLNDDRVEIHAGDTEVVRSFVVSGRPVGPGQVAFSTDGRWLAHRIPAAFGLLVSKATDFQERNRSVKVEDAIAVVIEREPDLKNVYEFWDMHTGVRLERAAGKPASAVFPDRSKADAATEAAVARFERHRRLKKVFRQTPEELWFGGSAIAVRASSPNGRLLAVGGRRPAQGPPNRSPR